MAQRLYAAETNHGLTAFTASEMELIEQASRNLVESYLSASEYEREIGTGWYSGEAGELARHIADETGIELPIAVAVVAVCSPSTHWEIQAENTAAFVRHILDGGSAYDAPRCSLYTTNLDKAALIIRTGDLELVTGPKVRPFFYNILGDDSIVTLDVWAVRAALQRHTDEADTNRWTKGRRRLILEAAYHKAAERLQEPVAAVQAVTWIVERGWTVDQ